MKKNSNKKANKSSLKKIKEEIKVNLESLNYQEAISNSIKYIELNPNSLYGYESSILAKTNNYNKYLDIDEIKEVKKIYNDAFKIASKNEKAKLKQEFDDYLYDIKEVDNLNKIKKEIVSKEFLKNLYNDALTFINQNLTNAKSYAKDGKKIKNIYDFIKGLFLFCCLIYNICSPNHILWLTVPFGVFGFINMNSFIEMNFLKKGKYKIEKKTYKKMFKASTIKIKNIKEEIKKIEENIKFLNVQKNSSISKLPELFSTDIEFLIINNEKALADQISNTLASGDVVKFTLQLEEATNLNAKEIIDKISSELKNEDDESLQYVNKKLLEKKESKTNKFVMKKVKKFDIFILIFTLFISIGSFIIVINNFYELNKTAFIVAIVVGILSMLIYNIDTGKHSSLSETYYDNLLNTVFNATLAYDLVYAKITNGLQFTYGFLQIPLTLLLIFIGFVQIISFFKYVHLYKKLSN